MNETSASDQSPNKPSFPKAILSVSRKEHYHQPLGLNILSRKNDCLQTDAVNPSSADFLDPQYWQLHSPQNTDVQGPLPSTLKGHVFVIGTAGSFDSQLIEGSEHIYLPTQDGWQHIYSGDGMIYRLDFHTSTPPVACADKPILDQPSAHMQGWAHLATRLIKTPDYYADLALETKPRYQTWPNYKQSTFRDAALTRLSMSLGGRNYLNTAWLPLKPKHSDSERLLVTWDAGRPYEVDPCSLGLVAPVGLNKDWKPIFDMTGVSHPLPKLPGLGKKFPILSQIFPMILSSAHPVYDDEEDAVYMVNGSKSLKSMMQVSRLAPYFKKGFLKFLDFIEDPEQTKPQPSVLDYVLLAVLNVSLFLLQGLMVFLSWLGIGGRDHLFLYRWQGHQTEIDDSDKWEVVNADGHPIPIYQSVHQMVLTKDYIVISDSSFKFVVADVLPSLFNPQNFAKNLRRVVNVVIGVKNASSKLSEPFPIPTSPQRQNIPEFGENLREHLQFLFSFLNYAQTPYTDVYVIPRIDLDTPNTATSQQNAGRYRKVKAKHFRLEPETAHFLASYDNPENKVVLHVGHIKGLDPAEFVNKIDQAVCNYSPETNSALPCSEETNQILRMRSGVLANSMSPNQVGTWTLDLQTGKHEKVILEDEDKFQLLAFFAFNEKTAHQITDVYWNCGGAWPYHHTINHLDLYKNQIEADVLDQQINQIAKEGRPSNLLRVSQANSLDQTNPAKRNHLKVEDYYAFPPGYYASSPQFVPKEDNSGNLATHGYIVCVVVATDHSKTDCTVDKKLSELWILDAADLRQGPLYRLNHPELNIGPTLHTAWLSKLEAPPSRQDYDVREDYKTVLSQVEPEVFRERVLDLFEQDVFPHVIHDRADATTKTIFKIRIFDSETVALELIQQKIENFASVCGYSDPMVTRDDRNTLFRDVHYQVKDQLTQAQQTEMISMSFMLCRESQSHLATGPEKPVFQVVQECAKALVELLTAMTHVDNAVFLLGQLMIIKSTNPEQNTKTYVKRIPDELKKILGNAPELLDSSQAMVNFLYNRAELPEALTSSQSEAIADHSAPLNVKD